MSFNDESNNTPPKKFKLRRIGLQKNDEDMIMKNLEPLKHYVQKKKRAQEAYYEGPSSNSGKSPLIRNLSRRPVKMRLGRRVPFNGTNTSAIPPKIRLHRLNGGTSNNVIGRRKLFGNRFQQHSYNSRSMAQASMMPQSTPKKIQLRRLLPNNLNKPQNLKVEVRNNVLHNKRTYRRFKQILNHHIQNDIKKLQAEFQSDERFPVMNVKPVTTNIKLSERFAILF